MATSQPVCELVTTGSAELGPGTDRFVAAGQFRVVSDGILLLPLGASCSGRLVPASRHARGRFLRDAASRARAAGALPGRPRGDLLRWRGRGSSGGGTSFVLTRRRPVVRVTARPASRGPGVAERAGCATVRLTRGTEPPLDLAREPPRGRRRSCRPGPPVAAVRPALVSVGDRTRPCRRRNSWPASGQIRRVLCRARRWRKHAAPLVPRVPARLDSDEPAASPHRRRSLPKPRTSTECSPTGREVARRARPRCPAVLPPSWYPGGRRSINRPGEAPGTWPSSEMSSRHTR